MGVVVFGLKLIECIVFEDVFLGVKIGVVSGVWVVVVCISYKRVVLEGLGVYLIVDDFLE